MEGSGILRCVGVCSVSPSEAVGMQQFRYPSYAMHPDAANWVISRQIRRAIKLSVMKSGAPSRELSFESCSLAGVTSNVETPCVVHDITQLLRSPAKARATFQYHVRFYMVLHAERT